MARLEADDTDSIKFRIRRLVDEAGADLVSAYYDPTSPFAGSLFDDMGLNPTSEISHDDLLAVSLLDVSMKPVHVRSLVGSETTSAQLKKIDVDTDLWSSVEMGNGSASWLLWKHLQQVEGIGRTRASKLMARKRPRLFTILDTVVCNHLGLGNVDAWAALRSALQDENLRSQIDGLWTDSADTRPSTLRLLDVATWMRHSRSRNARQVQKALGLT